MRRRMMIGVVALALALGVVWGGKAALPGDGATQASVIWGTRAQSSVIWGTRAQGSVIWGTRS